MPVIRSSEGSAFESRGRFFMRVIIGGGKRPAKRVPWATGLEQADARAKEVQGLVNRLRAAGQLDFIENLVKSGAAADAEKMAALVRAVDGIVGGQIVKTEPSVVEAKANTFGGVGNRWLSGELHRLYPDHVRKKKSARDDGYRLEILYATGIEHVPVSALTLDLIERSMRELDAVRARRAERAVKPLDAGSRRQYAQLFHRVLGLAVYPLRLLPASPLPSGWLPRVPNDKAKGLVYPDEETAFLADERHPIHWRIFFGALARLGFRADEAAGLTIADVDVGRGIITLDENKTDDPRAPMYPLETIEALKWWKKTHRANAEATDLFFVRPDGKRIPIDGLAEIYRDMLEATVRAKDMYRPELFTPTKSRLQIRVHDLRGAFVTYALANGRTETWVSDRTGHKSSQQINGYRRVARTVAEAGLGDLAALFAAIPECAATLMAAKLAAKPKQVDGRAAVKYRKHPVKGLIAQSVELRTFNSQLPETPEDFRDVSDEPEDLEAPPATPLPPSAATFFPDPLEATIGALAAALGAATSDDARVKLADAIGRVTEELRARRMADAGNVLNINAKRR